MRTNYFYEFGRIILIGVILGLLTVGVVNLITPKKDSKSSANIISPTITTVSNPTDTSTPTTTPTPTIIPSETLNPTAMPTISSPHYQINNPGGVDNGGFGDN